MKTETNETHETREAGDGKRGSGSRLRAASNSTLPMVSALPDRETMDQARELMETGIRLKCEISEREEELDMVVAKLAAIADANGLEKGFRWGKHAFEYHGWKTKKTLKVERLVAEGVSATVIERCYVEGKPYLSSRLYAFDLD